MTDPIQTLRDTLNDSCIDAECRAINAAEHAEPDAMRDAAESALTQVENLVEEASRSVDIGDEHNRCRICWETWGHHADDCALAPFKDTP